MKNPIITREGKTVYADGKPIGDLDVKALDENIVFYFNEKGDNFMAPHGWFFLNLMDTPEHAQELANNSNAKAGRAAMIFFPGTLARRPNFPVIWKKKAYHPGIIAAVQGQFRGGTKLHIEYMTVRPGFRRNKIMDKLITFLEQRFEPKAKEFHELTKDGTAFVKGTKRNPFPADNELPDDFKPNFKDWNFKLNVEGTSDDTYAKLKLVVDEGHLRVSKDDDSNYYIVESIKTLLTEDPTIYLRRVGASSDRLVGVIKNSKAIIREIIEKGMKQEGYKVKKNSTAPKKNPVKSLPKLEFEEIE